MKASVIKPGLLVSLHTSVRGGVNYQRATLEKTHQTGEGALREKWETTKVITDPDEFDRATSARGKARSLIAGVCCHSAFGMLCPSDKEQELADAITQARAVADAHNAEARLTRVEVYVLVGRVAQDDAEAARAIASEVRELLGMMETAVRAGNVEDIREAANKARAIGGMLSAEVSGKVDAAIEQARRIARDIVKRVEKGSETAAQVVAGLKLQAIEDARFAFLDMDGGKAEPIAPAARPVDIEPAPSVQAAPAPQLSLEV